MLSTLGISKGISSEQNESHLKPEKKSVAALSRRFGEHKSELIQLCCCTQCVFVISSPEDAQPL